MKILVVCQYYKPEPFRISDICEELARRGHEVTVLTGVPNYPMGEIYEGYRHGEHRCETVQGVEVRRCFTIGRRRGAIWRFLNYYSFAISSKCAAAGPGFGPASGGDFDVVLVNQLSPVMMASAGVKYAKEHNVPLAMYCLDLWPESLCAGGIRKGSAVYRLFHRISGRIYRACDRILMTSRGFEKYLTEEFGIAPEKLGYLPQYAEELFSETSNEKDGEKAGEHDRTGDGVNGDGNSNGCSCNSINLVFAGNIGAAQRVDLIIRAAAILKDERVHWHIVGDGSELEACRKLASELGAESVTFHGRHPVEEMPKFYGMADAMLLTLDDDEVISYTLPGKIQSYMAAGKPVIGSANGETPRVIADAACGICAPAGSAEALAEAVQSFASMTVDQRREMAQNSASYYAAHFRREIFMDKLETELMEWTKF
jgi:glycosyltransferase involved in cell wall biosynthesis